MMAPLPKTIGRYDILELVGRGGMGVLYRARDPVLERDVAVKMMLIDFTQDQTARERFEREAKAVARLQHRNVVTIHELGDVEGTPYIVMELLTGKDLDALLKGGAPLTLAQKIDIVSQLCEGLGYAHEQGIVHRDVKPGNVRVLEDGTVKILDFGIAKFAQSSVTQSGTIMGTPSYMAPEQIMGKAVDGRADLFSAGVLLYEILSGHKPFSGDSPTTVVYQIMHVEPPPIGGEVPDLPPALQEIVSRALQKNPDERYTRASEMASDLQVVKMMLDLPLKGQPESPATAKTVAIGKLHATTIGTKPPVGVTVALDAPMRGTAAARVADAAPERSHPSGGRNLGTILGVIGAVAAVIVIGILIGLRGSGTTTNSSSPPATTSTTGGVQTPHPSSGPPPAADVFVVSSVPAGAHITLNGTDTGKITPAAVPLGKFPAAIELTLKGYEKLAASVTDADARDGGKEFKLAREAGPVHLTIAGSFPFDVLQGSKVLSAGATHHDVTVVPGGGTVTVRNPDFLLDSSIAIDYQRSQADVTLSAPGTLAVFASLETCKISVDGQDFGFPPIPAKRVASGNHTVVLKCPDGKEETRRVTVPSGDRIAVTFGSERNGPS